MMIRFYGYICNNITGIIRPENLNGLLGDPICKPGYLTKFLWIDAFKISCWIYLFRVTKRSLLILSLHTSTKMNLLKDSTEWS